MTTCLTELFLWSLKGNIAIPDYVIGCHKYHEKGDTENVQKYTEEKQQFVEGRSMTWAPKNKRPDKLRDNIKEMEELLSAFKVVHYRWRSRKVIQIILSNVCIINVILTGHSGDIERLMIDKSLVGKLSGETVSDAYMTDQYLMATYSDKNKVDYVYFCKRPPLGEALKKLEKLSAWEPKVHCADAIDQGELSLATAIVVMYKVYQNVTTIEIPGPVGRRLDRKISVNIHQDMVLVWWSNTSKDAMPWSPMATEKERANLIVISIHGPNTDILTYTKTEFDPLFAEFSKLQPHKIYSVEQGMSSGGETTLKNCLYEVIQGQIQKVSVVTIPLKSLVQCQCRSPGEDKLLLGCTDGSLVLHDENKKTTQINRAGLVPAIASWHPTGTLFFVGSVRGDIQIFDMALSPVRVQLIAEEPCPSRVLQTSKFFKSPPQLKEITWCPFDPAAADWSGDYTDVLGLVYDRGPIGVLMLSLGVISRDRLSCLELVKEYIKSRQIDEAVSLLCAMNWDTDGDNCYACLTTIVTHLLKMPLNAEREGFLETALGTFYAPKKPLSEGAILDYRDPISRLARRFFHHLLRYARFDKAYLLAVDIGARDLFMDIHFMALDKGETALAEVARRKADQIDSESLDSFEDDLPGIEGQFYHQSAYNDIPPPLPHRQTDRQPEIPPSRQHPWQQDQRSSHNSQLSQDSTHSSSPGGSRSQTRNRSRRRVHYNEQDLDRDFDGINLNSDLISDYTAALNDGTQWNQDQQQNGDGGRVKVLNFAVV